MLAIGRRGKLPFLGDLDDRPNGKDKIEEASGDLGGKAPDLDGIAPEILKYGGKQ